MALRPRVVLGPLIRYCSEREAVIWLEVNQPGRVMVDLVRFRRVVGTASAVTVSFGLRYYVLVVLDRLRAATAYEYQIRIKPEDQIEEHLIWPDRFFRLPVSTFRTMPRAGEDLAVSYVSCRTSHPTIEALMEKHKDAADPVNEAINEGNGVDALRAWAQRLYRGRSLRRFRWPHLIVMMGDQIYADSLTVNMKERIKPSRERLRDRLLQQGIALSEDEFSSLSGQLLSFEEYRAAYIESWSNPEVRWALSCIPSLMVFDDHEVIDDWNLSKPWLNEQQRLPWWASQFVGALSAYWLYQGAGNLAPKSWRTEPKMRMFRPTATRSSRSGTAQLRSQFFQIAAGRRQRFSYTFDAGATRFVVADLRSRRVLNPYNRQLMDDEEWDWFEKQCTGSSHPFLVMVISMPAFMPSLIHSLWGVVEGVSNSPTALAVAGEWVRQKVDVEHWAAFPKSFDALAKLLRRLGGEGGAVAKRTVLLVSGDVHFSYNMEVSTPTLRSGSRILQLVSSPARKSLSGSDAGVIQAMQSLSSLPASQAGVTWKPLITPNGWLWFGNFMATFRIGHAGITAEYDRAAVAQVRRDVNGRVETKTETRLIPVTRFRR